jgi:hypothetical protein
MQDVPPLALGRHGAAQYFLARDVFALSENASETQYEKRSGND